jgi:hypothetical protein
MTNQEIEKAAKEWGDNFGGSTIQIAQIKQVTARLSYRKGAEMVNQKQPYSAEDMKLFFVFCYENNWIPTSSLANGWINAGTDEYKNFDELIKLWEESRNG